MLMLTASGLLYGCGSGLSGVYVSEDSLFDEQLKFISSKKVEYTIDGRILESEYQKKENTLSISTQGVITKYTIDNDGCLVGGPWDSKFCKK